MSFSETGIEGAAVPAPQLEGQVEATNRALQPREDFRHEISNQWPGVPAEAVDYFAANCSAPAVLPIAIQNLQASLVETPSALDDPNLAILELEYCLGEAENAVLEASLATEQAANDKRLTTNEMLSAEIDKIYVEAAQAGGGVDNVLARTRSLLAEHPQLQSYEAKEIAFQKIDQMAAMVADMRGVFTDPVSQAAFEDILASSSIDLGADTLVASFAPVLEQVETSEAISDVDKVRLRHIVTGTDVQGALAQTVTDEDGKTEYRWTDKNQRQIRAGVGGYASPSGRQMIEAKAGDHIITRDVTGWSGEDIGLVVELMHYWHMSESDGTTGFIENVYKIEFSVLDSGGAFDPLTVNKFRQVISHLTGGFAGYDGDIENFEQQRKLIRDQNRLLSQTMTTFGWENDQAGTMKVLIRLGFQDQDGNINMDVIKSFGDYTQRYYASGNPDNLDVVTFLSERNPELVQPLTEEEQVQGFLEIEQERA